MRMNVEGLGIEMEIFALEAAEIGICSETFLKSNIREVLLFDFSKNSDFILIFANL